MSCQAEIGIGTAVPPFLGHCLRNLVISAGAGAVQPIYGLSLLKTRHRAGFKALLRHQQAADNNMEFANYGPFELLQARQLIESNIAEFAATQVTKQDIMKLMEIQEKSRNEKSFRDSEWDLQFHVQVALATQNSALAAIVEKMWTQRIHNPYWKKLHDHIDLRTVDNWCDDHDQILRALIRKDPHAAKLAMWQHLENTKQMLFNETSDDFEFNADRYLFADNPVVHLDTASSQAK